MVLLNFMDIGWLETIESHTISLDAMEFFLIKNLQEEVNFS